MKYFLISTLLVLSNSLFAQSRISFSLSGALGMGEVVSTVRPSADPIFSQFSEAESGFAQSLRLGGTMTYRINGFLSARFGSELGLHRYEYAVNSFCDFNPCKKEGVNQLWFSEAAFPLSVQYHFPAGKRPTNFYLGAGAAYTLLLAKHSVNADFWSEQYGREPLTSDGFSYLLYFGINTPSGICAEPYLRSHGLKSNLEWSSTATVPFEGGLLVRFPLGSWK